MIADRSDDESFSAREFFSDGRWFGGQTVESELHCIENPDRFSLIVEEKEKPLVKKRDSEVSRKVFPHQALEGLERFVENESDENSLVHFLKLKNEIRIFAKMTL